MVRIRIILIFLIAANISCKKTELKGDLSFLVGEWNWTFTEVRTGLACDLLTVKTPQTEGYTYKLRFEEKGRLRIYKNDDCLKKYRLVEDGVNVIVPVQEYGFSFELNNKDKNGVYFRFKKGSPDTIFNSTYPMDVEGGCIDRENVFIRL